MAAPANLVHQTSAGTGTGNLTLIAQNGKQSFATAFGTGVTTNVFEYFISNQGAAEWEYGTGHMSDATTLVRDTVILSTNSNAAVSFSSGTKDVTNDVKAENQVRNEGSTNTDEHAVIFDGTTGRKIKSLGARVPVSAPQGRLTNSTGVPVVTATVSGASTMYYTPHRGRSLPIFGGSNYVMTDTGGELSQTLSDTTKSPAATVQDACYDVFVWSDSGTMRATRGPAWAVASTITVTIATPAVVTWTGHPLKEGDPVVFTTTGALPTGITAGTTYYVGRSPATNTFNISTTVANAAAGTFVATSGTQSGTHTGTNRTRSRGSGAGTTELTLVQGFNLNANSITNGPAAQRGTYVGTFRTNPSNTVDFIFGANAASGTGAVLNVWNAYNRVPVVTFVQDNTNSWTYSTATWRRANNASTMSVNFVMGLAEDAFQAFYKVTTSNDASGGGFIGCPRACGVGYDATNSAAAGSSPGKTSITTGTDSNASTITPIYADLTSMFVKSGDIGAHFVQAIEISSALGTTTWYGDDNAPTITEQNQLTFSGWF